MIWNETVNAARLGLRAQQALTLLVTVADIEGVPPPPMTMSHDITLYDEVRRRLS